MKVSGRTVAVLVPLAIAGLAVPSIAVAQALSDDQFYACADASGELYGAWVGTAPDCAAYEADYNAMATEMGMPTVDLRKVEWTNGGQGPQGPAGTNLSGYKQIKKTFSVGARKTGHLYAGCPTGQVPVNGGADGSTSVDMRMSFPTAAGWKVRVYNDSSSSKSVSVWVSCANAPVTPAA